MKISNFDFVSSILWRCPFALCLSAMALIGLVNSTQPCEAQTLYKAGKVITMTGETVQPGMVMVENGKIAAIAENIQVGDAEIVDLGAEAVIMPGLVDAYSQAGLAVSTTDEFSREVTPDFQVVHGVDWDSLAMRKLREGGTTTVCVCPGRENVVGGLSAVIKTSEQGDSPILNEIGPLITNICSDPASRNSARRRPDSIYVRQPTNRMGVVWLFRSHFSRAQTASEAEANEGTKVLKQTINGKQQIFMFCRKSHDVLSSLVLAEEFGLKPVLVGGHESYQVLDELKEAGVTLILTPVPTGLMAAQEGSSLCLNRAGKLADEGIEFCLSGENLLEQARFAVRFGLDPEKALQAITTVPAKLLGVDDRVGSLAVGKHADMIVLNGDPIELTTSVSHVIIGGELANGPNENNAESTNSDTE